MAKQTRALKTSKTQRRDESLSRDQIIQASIGLLDETGEDGLTFRALSERLTTGPGAIYGHIANKSDLLTAACDAVIAGTMRTPPPRATPQEAIRHIAVTIFDVIDAHPWVGSALTHAPGQSPMLHVVERLGQQIRLLGVPRSKHWVTVSALLNYILGVGGRNAANGQFGRAQNLDRASVLDSVATTWSQLDPEDYPFVRSIAGKLRSHDDRKDFLAGIDIILNGIATLR